MICSSTVQNTLYCTSTPATQPQISQACTDWMKVYRPSPLTQRTLCHFYKGHIQPFSVDPHPVVQSVLDRKNNGTAFHSSSDCLSLLVLLGLLYIDPISILAYCVMLQNTFTILKFSSSVKKR